MLRRLVVYSVSALVAASADAGERRPVVVTRDHAELHAGCRPGAVAERIWDFMVAFNRAATRGRRRGSWSRGRAAFRGLPPLAAREVLRAPPPPWRADAAALGRRRGGR